MRRMTVLSFVKYIMKRCIPFCFEVIIAKRASPGGFASEEGFGFLGGSWVCGIEGQWLCLQ